MAFTVSREHSVFGNKKVALLTVTADATSGVIDSGLSVINCVTFAPKSMTTIAGTFQLKPNELTAATASNGKLHIVDSVSGDAMFIVCYGR